MEVFITKWALTQGILKRDVKWDGEIPNMIQLSPLSFVHKPHWHTSELEAKEYANILLKNKISTLEGQIKRLKEKSF